MRQIEGSDVVYWDTGNRTMSLFLPVLFLLSHNVSHEKSIVGTSGPLLETPDLMCVNCFVVRTCNTKAFNILVSHRGSQGHDLVLRPLLLQFIDYMSHIPKFICLHSYCHKAILERKIRSCPSDMLVRILDKGGLPFNQGNVHGL